MRRRIMPIMLSMLLLATATAAAGCGSDPGPAPGTVPGVSGAFGTDPVVTIPPGHPSGQLVVQTVLPGHGPVVRSGDYVLFNVQGKVWAGDREVVDSYTNRQPQGLPLDSRATLPAWRHLAGQRVGSRVVMVVPPRDGFGRQGDPQANIMGSDTLIFVFDLLSAVPEHSDMTGQPFQAGPGLPDVTWTAHGPSITVPKAARPPAKLVRDVLVRGHGRPVQNGDTVVVQDTGVVWRTGTVFDSSWARGFPESFVLGSGQVIPGWESGLGGLPVGSRVLLVLPPSLGYGQAGNPPDVGAHDTLVFVIDILAAV
jgi:peptidylprolyl isomerase